MRRDGPLTPSHSGRPGIGGAATESWFLRRGLPSVLTRRARWRRIWPRSAPMLAAYATLQASALVIFSIVGSSEVHITGNPAPAEWVVLGILAVDPVLMTLVGWLVSRLRSTRTRAAASAVSVALVACGAMITTGPTQLLPESLVIARGAAADRLWRRGRCSGGRCA